MGSSMLLRIARVFAATDAELVVDAAIRIEDGVIISVGRAEEFGSEVQATDPVDGTALPGFVDSHAHPTLPADGRSLRVQAEAGPEIAALTAAWQLRRHLYAGYTTVMDCGAKGTTGFAVRSAAASGLIAGPRLLAVGRPITPTRGHMYWCGSEADGPAEIGREVSILTSEGADAIKIIASGGGTGGVPTRPSYDQTSLNAAVAAAHDQGLRIVAHCRASEAIARCAMTRMDVIAHLEFIEPGPVEDFGGGAPTAIPRFDPRVGEAVAASGAYLDLNPHSSGWDTLLDLRARSEPGQLPESDRARMRALERYFEAMLDVIRQLAALGLADRMSFGSDAGPFDTEFGHPEYNVQLARLAGLAPHESIQVITRNAARSIGLGDEVGTIEAGKRGDLVVVRGNPLDDPGVLVSPISVIKGGSLVR